MTTSADEIYSKIEELVESSTTELEVISPDNAVENFIEYKQTDVRPQTLIECRRKLDHFLDFCSREEIENLNELNGRSINDYRKYRRTESSSQVSSLAPKTMRDDMYLFREFVQFLEHIEAVVPSLSEKVEIPKMGPKDGVRDLEIEPERVDQILTYLNKYEYATRAHVIWLFHSHTGRRPGGLYALDLDDLHLDIKDAYIELRHRPDETELKNGDLGETEIYIADDVAQIFRDYIKNNRIEVTTENDRKPFLTSSHGRLSKTTMRKDVYRFTRPCVIQGECPHDRDIESCEALESGDKASKCPSSLPPYALRHGYITCKLRDGAPSELISGRCDVSEVVIEKHYDERTETEKRELRKEVFEAISKETNGEGYL